jgi:hypothetical protein
VEASCIADFNCDEGISSGWRPEEELDECDTGSISVAAGESGRVSARVAVADVD